MRRLSNRILFIILFLSLALIVVAVVWLQRERRERQIEHIGLVAPTEVYFDNFLYHPDAWNKVFENASSMSQFLNGTVEETEFGGMSVPEIAGIFGGVVYENSPGYAYCYIRIPESNLQSLTETFTELGFEVRPVTLLTPD